MKIAHSKHTTEESYSFACPTCHRRYVVTDTDNDKYSRDTFYYLKNDGSHEITYCKCLTSFMVSTH